MQGWQIPERFRRTRQHFFIGDINANRFFGQYRLFSRLGQLPKLMLGVTTDSAAVNDPIHPIGFPQAEEVCFQLKFMKQSDDIEGFRPAGCTNQTALFDRQDCEVVSLVLMKSLLPSPVSLEI